MTVSYSKQVATSSKAACFLRLLLRWRGSIYKLLWKDFAVFAFLYYLLGFIYRFALNERGKSWFESVAEYCQAFGSLIPVAFVLGFYVSLVVSRFWEQFKSIPWPSRMALFVSALLQGNDQRGRLMRRSIMRYLCLAYVLTMSSISPPVKKRFPTLQHVTDAGFLLPNEQKILEGMKTKFNTYFVPLVWAASLVSRARKEGRIKDDFAVKTLIDEINDYRGKCGSLFSYDWVTVPLVYTQVVTIAVYTFFFSCLMGRQFLENGHFGDMYFPLFTFLQFLFYMGWLKVAETLLNPFGEDDDDFDINRLIDSNLQSSYLVVDEMHQEHPELIKDQYWDTVAIDLPYTQASQQYQKSDPCLGSAVGIKIPPSQAQFIGSGSMTKGSSMPRISEVAEDEEDADGDRLLSLKSGPKAQISGRKTVRPNPSLSRSSSRMGSLLTLVSRSISRISRRGHSTDAEDVESGLPVPHESPKDLIEMKGKRQGKPSKAKHHKDTTHDDMIFEMSDDESISSKQSVAAMTSDVNKAEDQLTAAVNEQSTGKGNNKLTMGQSYRSNKLPSTASDTSKVEENYGTLMSQADAAFVDELRGQLRELRETKEPPRDKSTVKVD